MNGRHACVRAAAVVAALCAMSSAAGSQPIPRGAPGATPSLAPRQPSVAPVLSRAQVDALLGPLRLVRPLAPETLERLVDEGESVYRSRNLPQALEAFGTLVELDPRNVHAWLRLGNLHQQAGRDADALHAYRRAGTGAPRSARDDASRGKALLNVAMLGIAQAEQALDAFDREHDPDGVDDAADLPMSARDEAVRRLADLQRRTERHAEPAPPSARRPTARTDAARPVERAESLPVRPAVADPGVRAGPEVGAVRRVRADTPADDEAFEPYTVDRWTGRARRASVRPASGRGALVEPVTESPLPVPPAVEVLRGAIPGRARP